MIIEKKLSTIFFSRSLNIIMMFALLCLSACLQSPSNSRKALISANNSTNNKTTTKLPDFKEGNNYIQNGGVVYTTNVSLDLSFSDTLQLRGKDVDNYIRNNGTQTITCLSGRFTATTVKQIFVMAALPQSIYNASTKTLEYYYTLAPSDEVANKNFCQKSALINKLYTLYQTLTPTYKLSALCPSGVCVSTTYNSESLELFSQSGTPLTQVATRQLSYVITNRPLSSTPSGKTCTSTVECISLGYDCCSLGQCVKDLALKTGVDKNSPSYIQALQDILSNPAHVYNYPQYYYLCSSVVNLPTDPSNPTNPVNEANLRLNRLQDLYNCTTKIEGEMGICTKTIKNAAKALHLSVKDDRSFSTTYTNQANNTTTPTQPLELTSIQEVNFGEVTLFNYDQITNESILSSSPLIYSEYLTFTALNNDDITTETKIELTKIPTNAVNQDLVIKYKVDASCIQLNTALAKCEKYYIQGQQNGGDTPALHKRGRVTDHYPASNNFKLPAYVDTGKTIVVEVDGVTQKKDIDWQLLTGTPASVDFYPTKTGGLRVVGDQKVKITYFVNLSIYDVMNSKTSALEEIQTMCHCADTKCSLSPIKNTAGKITDYACVYPDPNPVTPPVSQTVYLSAKNVPVRYFDSAGVSKSIINGETLSQEGTPFAYYKDNLLNPNNMPDITAPDTDDHYIGFNEIYGSLSYANNSAKAAKEVSVTKGKTYDIYVDKGAYSNCIQCGNDYYTQLNKLFPLTQFAGGLTPLQSRTDRSASNGIRADDFSFGRACFIPATMIPWTHAIASETKEQRLSRLRAQHFLYANGYQHDWYGFDYGSVIGSFDGVKWFAVGSNRRIKADTHKLFLAVNGPFGDLAIENTYTVTINDGSLNPVGSNMVTSDFQSDGAECQKFHQCSTDNDCATTLGWDYACANVNEITTSWPRFDDNAKEIPDSNRDDNKLVGILGLSTSGKRCVYRGRGAACTQNYLNILETSTFNASTSQAIHSCSSNHFCQQISNGNSLNASFNNRIARYGKVRTDETSDRFGLGVKVPGRPMEFNASETMKAETLRNFNSNKLAGVCIPGRTPEVESFTLQNSTIPSSQYLGDRVLGIGMTYPKISTASPLYFSACSVMDETNNYFANKVDKDNLVTNSANTDLQYFSGTQSISTNALYIFKQLFDLKSMSFPLYTENYKLLTTQTFSENRCMRAPGASCFSDLDCAPSKVIADKIKLLNSDDDTITAFLNKYEINFWKEELVCSQATTKNDPSYSPFKNRCCREVGKSISLPSKDITNGLIMDKVAGIDFSFSTTDSNKYRYSRNATLYKDSKTDASNYPTLQVPIKDQCGTSCFNNTPILAVSSLTNQFKTFSAFGERTSCSGDWIRNFANGNHEWNHLRLQSFDLGMFQCMNWSPGDNGGVGNYTCKGLDKADQACQMTATSKGSAKAKGILNYLAKLELMGIPQIALPSEQYFNSTTDGDLSCRSFPGNQNGCYPGHLDQSSCANATNGIQQSSLTRYAYPSQLFVNHYAIEDSQAAAVASDAVTRAMIDQEDKNDILTEAIRQDDLFNTPATHTARDAAQDAANAAAGAVAFAQNNALINIPLKEDIINNKIKAFAELVDTSSGKSMYQYSGVDSSNFQNSIRQIFKPDEIVSCYPAGTTMNVGADKSLCCTGFINSQNNKCQLPDYVDLSVYTNRYVSSEAKKLSPNLFNQDGYVNDPGQVATLACQRNMCASGKVAFGVLISNLKIPGQEKTDTKVMRFLEGNSAADDFSGLLSVYRLGLKLNNHAYCFPKESTGASAEDIQIISCTSAP